MKGKLCLIRLLKPFCKYIDRMAAYVKRMLLKAVRAKLNWAINQIRRTHRRRLWGFFKKIRRAARKATRVVRRVAKRAVKVVKKVGRAINKFTKGKFGQLLANRGCPLAVKAFAKGVRYAMITGLGCPPSIAHVPGCILRKMCSECKKQVLKWFMKKRVARRLGLVKGELAF